jgi:NAD(P)-dependent dehydrogenase (short-subunit alcohol dehydrogenase family)
MKKKTVLITGAGRGVGRATAVRLARTGGNLVIVARTESQLNETKALITSGGGACLAISADLTDVNQPGRIVDAAVDRFGKIDALINNAGVAPLSPLTGTSRETFDQVFAINNRAMFQLTQAVWPVMKAAGGGAIVNLSSFASVDPFPGFSVYGASKAWVNTFSLALSAEGQPDGIRVYCLALGAVDTEMLRGPFPDFPADQCLQPEEVAAKIEAMLTQPEGFPTGEPIFYKK